MKILKFNENIDNIIPQVGDYVLMNDHGIILDYLINNPG